MLPYIVIGLSSLSLLSLIVLHFVSPNFKPSWRMISEYALGNHKWLIILFFICWGLAFMLLTIPLWTEVSSIWAKIGVVLVFI
ncbi:DUF998 domain-containing protein [Algoriphagus sp. Y33]|uniref:DUF998 domain-containing protein n=1 Tax=Algoriphagus sp. Y33 TaxID=2772483 RepID=UPI00178360E3